MEKSSIVDEWGKFVTIPKDFTQASKVLTDKARWLFVLLREYTNGESGIAFPSYDTIRERTGWGRSQISNAIKCLEKHGWLTKTPQFGGVNLYSLKRPSAPNNPKPELLETTSSNNPKMGRQKSQSETPIVPNRDAIKTEITKTEIIETEILANVTIHPPQTVHAGIVRKDGIEAQDELREGKGREVGNEPPSTPVSVAVRAPRKTAKIPKTTGHPDHRPLMDYLAQATGQPILDGGAQGKAVATILKHYTAEQARAVLDWQLHSGKWKGKVSWLSVQNYIGEYYRTRSQGESTTNEKNTLTSRRRTYEEICAGQPFMHG